MPQSVSMGGNHWGQDGTSTAEDPTWSGWRGNYVPPLAPTPLVTFSDSFRVNADEIEATYRDNAEVVEAYTFNTHIGNSTLIITVPTST